MSSACSAASLSEIRTNPADTLDRKIRDALARGLAAHRSKSYDQAIAAYDEALGIEPTHIAALVNKGAALRQLGRQAEAIACYWQALAAAPDSPEAWSNAANALADLRRDDEAQAVLGVVLRRQPSNAEAWAMLGQVLVRQGHPAVAESCLRRALAITENHGAARLQLAGLLATRGDSDAALEEYSLLQGRLPREPAALSGLGQTLISAGRLKEAEAPLRAALVLKEDHLDARLGLARLKLLRGDLSEAWPDYEARRLKVEKRYPKLAGPEWDGSDPAGKTILVYAEQGFGDTLHFARYLPLLAARGAKVVMVCQQSLLRLMQSVEGVARAQSNWRPLPPYDAWTPLLSLPLRFGTGADSVPAAVPYLRPPRGGALLPAPLGARVKVGLVWAGSPTHPGDAQRSLALSDLLPVTGVHGAAFYSLQKGPRAGDARRFAHPALLHDMSAVLGDFADTTDIVAGLDLVITADTAVAHLAGALGKPVWVLLPFVPDWRWQLGREDSPWYPSMRLYRQEEAGDWQSVVERVVEDLAALVASRPVPEREKNEIAIHSAIAPPAGDGPRFRMTAPRALLSDPGIRFLAAKERAGIAYEYATRSFLDAHLRPDDLFIDIGAHWGIMSLQAVTRWPGQVAALAIEPSPRNVPYLKQWLVLNGVEKEVEVIEAAAADLPGRGELKPESTMGHSLIKRADGAIPVVTVDGLLKDRPRLANRRVIVKIDVEGKEPEVIAGMKDLLESGRVAAVIWERGIEYETAAGQKRLRALRARFDALGFSAWRFESEDEAGALVPFAEDGRRGNIIELPAGQNPQPFYGAPRVAPSAQPADPAADAALEARRLFNLAMGLPQKGKGKEALALYERAALLDSGLSELYNNLGVLLRGGGCEAAAEACYRRALAISPRDTGILSNLGNTLRERGDFSAAERLHKAALVLRPGDAGSLYNAGIVYRDAGRPERALDYYQRSLSIDPRNPDYRWDRALALLQKGDYAAGLPAYEARWGLKRARVRKAALPAWDGSPLQGRSIFVTDEQGFGDVLQFARFLPELKRHGAGKVVLECQPELMRLLAATPGVDAVLPRDRAVPACDVTIPLLSLPALFGTTLETLPAQVPYLRAPDPARMLPDDGRLKMGVVWAGKTTPRDRSISLERLLPLLGDPRFAAFSLQVGPRAADLKTLGAHALITDLAPILTDFAETAAVLRQLDLLVTVDTAIAHLAGALGVRTFLLLRYTSDWRWFDRGEKSPWYPSMTLFRQPVPGNWDGALAELGEALRSIH